MTDGPVAAFNAMTSGSPHLVAILLLIPFLGFFLYMNWIELRRWFVFGPAENLRSRFPIDPTAPSYVPADEPAGVAPQGQLPRR